MLKTVRAKYSDGRFIPLTPQAIEGELKEGQEVIIIIASGGSPSEHTLQDTAGGWKDLIDAEALKRELAANRQRRTRPSASLDVS
jgi:hypothetical protein